ncbi:MAG: phosphoribosylamine--glycine ligase [Rhodothermales bacterium]
MHILIVGSGGREHALAWALARSPQQPTLYIAPGNAGTEALGENIDLPASDVRALTEFAQEKAIDLVVIGPEVPLVEGLADRLEEAGIAAIGPSAAAARLEGSKAFAKAFMARYGIPTAAHRTFQADVYSEAVAHVEAQGGPLVVKASGLAAGKGAVVCVTTEEALQTLDEMMRQRTFGEAGDEVVIEEFMEGEEASVFALTDGEHYVLLPPAQDHKRAGEGDTGPNTGGMGAYAPAPIMTGRLLTQTCREIIEPVLAGMAAEGHPYRGVLYAGLMVTPAGPKVVEFNCRLGDPEAQAVLPLLDVDLADVFDKLASGRLQEVTLQARAGASACVVLASGGYPGTYEKGFSISGIEEAEETGALVFHAGTGRNEDQVVTSGGRVLGVTGLGDSLGSALDAAYAAAEKIHFKGQQYRRDIGQKGLLRMKV